MKFSDEIEWAYEEWHFKYYCLRDPLFDMLALVFLL